MIRVDLHCHSYLSDGDHSPEDVARRLAAARVAWAALTDHNTVAGQERFRVAAAHEGVGVITGLEMDARVATGEPVHLLAYGFDPSRESLLRALGVRRRPLRTTARRWIGGVGRLRRRSSAGIAYEPSDVLRHPRRSADTEAAIALIHDARGLAFLAHPLAASGSLERLERVLDRLQEQGLDGLEVFYKPSPESAQRDLLGVARRRGLLTIAGSDYHGSHHAYGASPGVDMRCDQWERFATRLGLGPTPRNGGARGGR